MKKFYIILLSLLLIQLIDLSSGLRQYYKGYQYNYISENVFKNEDNFWKNLSFKITTLRSIKFKNQSDLYYDLRNVFLNYNFIIYSSLGYGEPTCSPGTIPSDID